MVVPAFCEGVQSLCQTWKEDIVHTKQMNNIFQLQQAIFFQTVKNFIIKMCHAVPDITPEAFNPRSERGIIQMNISSFKLKFNFFIISHLNDYNLWLWTLRPAMKLPLPVPFTVNIVSAIDTFSTPSSPLTLAKYIYNKKYSINYWNYYLW